MSRVIKFRAWTKDWDGVYRMSFSDKYEEDEIPTSAHQLMSYFFRNLNPNAELMQSTGLHDKNGVEVFEGDVIEIEGATAQVVFWEMPPEFGLNYYHNEDAWCEDWNLSDDCERMKVIGNIYQNPELLNPTQP